MGSIALVFRTFSGGCVHTPAPGEILIRPLRALEQRRRELAALVLQRGLEVLPRGPGAVERIVVNADPTLDDLLAATFAERLLAGRPLPEGARALASYAAVVREGLRPDAGIPPEESLEGIFQAIRNIDGDDLTNPDVAAAFAAAWSRLAECILRAAEAGQDLFRTPMCSTGPEFARERAYLARDREVYRREDVPRGEQWLVRIPGGPPRAAALLLRSPKSLLFKNWSRQDREAPVGEGYLFLAVDWGGGGWVFSTDPAHRLPIKSLAEALQAAEAARHHGHPDKRTWFDGAPFGHTLVAAPHGGTALPDDEVLRVVRHWAGARHASAGPGVARRRTLIAMAVCVLLAVTAALAVWRLHAPPALLAGVNVNGQPQGSVSLKADGEEVRGVNRKLDDRAPATWSAELEVNLRPGPNEVAFRASDVFRKSQLVRVWVTLRPAEALTGAGLSVQVNGEKAQDLTHLRRQGDELESEVVDTWFRGGDNTLTVNVTNPGSDPVLATVRVNWRVNPSDARGLYVLCVGVSKYPHLASDKQLSYPEADAAALAEACKRYGKGLFREVHCYGPLLNDKAKREDILEALDALDERRREDDLVIVTFAGHGDIDRRGDFFFLPADFDDKHPASTRVYWHEISRMLRMPCPVWVVLDTCHAGAIAGGRGQDMDQAAQPGWLRLRASGGSLVMTVACLAGEYAREKREWGHGALTLSLLEGLQGKQQQVWLPPGSAEPANKYLPRGHNGTIRLQDLTYYVDKRVEELTGGVQAASTNHTGNLALNRIGVGKRPE